MREWRIVAWPFFIGVLSVGLPSVGPHSGGWTSVEALGVANAAPRRQGARPMRLKVGNGTRRGVGLSHEADGWHLEVARVETTMAQIIDVTPGAPVRTLTLAIHDGELIFDPRRFVSGHVYQVSLMSDDASLGTRWVFLVPDPTRVKEPTFAPKEPQRLKFVDHETTDGDDTIQPVQKSF
jgi:hypothetical protein